MVALNPFFSLISFYEVEAGTQRWEIRVSMFAHRVIYGLNPAGGLKADTAGRPADSKAAAAVWYASFSKS